MYFTSTSLSTDNTPSFNESHVRSFFPFDVLGYVLPSLDFRRLLSEQMYMLLASNSTEKYSLYSPAPIHLPLCHGNSIKAHMDHRMAAEIQFKGVDNMWTGV